MPSFTQRDTLFLAYCTVLGILAGAVAARYPQTQSGPVPPFLWILIGMALFEAAGTLMGQNLAERGTATRFLGLCLGLGLSMLIPALAG